MQANLYRNFEFTFLFVKIISLSSSNFDRPIQKKKKKRVILIDSTSKEVRTFIQKFISYDYILFEQYNLFII